MRSHLENHYPSHPCAGCLHARRRPAALPLVGLWLLIVPAGCQNLPAEVAGCNAAGRPPSRSRVLAHQLIADSAAAVRQHPLSSSRAVVTQALQDISAVGRGAFGKRVVMHLQGAPQPLFPCRPTLDPCALDEELRRLLHSDLQPADVRPYIDGSNALAALEQVIDGARQRLDVLMFMWDQTPLGTSIASRLAARAGPGLRVRVLVDGGGNLMFGRPKGASGADLNAAVCWLAHQPYVEMIRTRDPCARFDHRKLVIADGGVAWTGGRNFIYEEFFERHDVSFTLTGPLVADLQDRFERFWEDQGGRPAEPLASAAACAPNAAARLVHTDPGEHSLERALYRAVDLAEHHLYVENPYLTDAVFIYKLAQARKRGVDVRVMLTVQSSTTAINKANRVTANRLLRAGVRVYLYPGPFHVKAAGVDGCWVYLGTGNFDPLSLRRNHELGLAVGAGPLITELDERLFRRDLLPEREMHAPFPLSAHDYLNELLASLFM